MTPHQVSEWLQVAVVLLTVTSLIGGLIYWITKPVITRWIADEVRKQLDVTMGPVQLQLTTMNGEIARIRIIEQKLENGLSQSVTDLKGEVREIRDHLIGERR